MASQAMVTSRPLVALAGNPNTGKSTLFNRLTGSRVRVGNYPGVTTDRRSGLLQIEVREPLELLDVPGTYSLVSRSAEEQVAIDALLGLGKNRRPDLVIVCVDATQLLRNLYLVLQLQEMGLRLLVALTMVDEAGDLLPPPSYLEAALGCRVIPVAVPREIGVSDLIEGIETELSTPSPEPRWCFGPSAKLRMDLDAVLPHLPADWPQLEALALWALMSIDSGDELANIPEDLRLSVRNRERPGLEIDDEVIEARYRWLDREIGPLLRGHPPRTWTGRVDRVLLHPVWGFAAFILVMFLLFQSLFSWSDPVITGIERLFASGGMGLAAVLGPGILTDFLVDGVIGGVGSVLVFLPQILLLFFFLGLMEDSGYLARIAYLMDRIMRTMKLHGRAFVPLLSGFACAIPAIMATRTMERRRDRLLTMMVVPLMTCSARLPVYTLIIASLFPPTLVWGFIPIQPALMVGMYLFSVTTALLAAWVLSKTVLQAGESALILELPPYRLPRIKDVVNMMWERARYFLSEAGTMILVCTIVLWALLSFPKHPYVDEPGLVVSATSDVTLQRHRQGEALRRSYGGQLGRFLEPVIAPLGFDWKIGIGLIGAFAAREVFVSTMGIVYNVGSEANEKSTTLREAIRGETRADGKPLYTPLTGLSLLIFFALACQCLSTLAVVRRETGSLRWTGFLLFYMSSLAWISSFAVYQGGRLLGFG